MGAEKTREPQYQKLVILRDTKGLTRLGLTANQVWHDDPRRLPFILARREEAKRKTLQARNEYKRTLSKLDKGSSAS